MNNDGGGGGSRKECDPSSAKFAVPPSEPEDTMPGRYVYDEALGRFRFLRSQREESTT